MVRWTQLPCGLYVESSGRVLGCDSDHDGRQELIFRTGTINPSDPLRWEVWEYRPVNRYELAYADTGGYPYPPGITTGNFRPFDVGDIDQDGFTDVVGMNEEYVPTLDSLYNHLVVMESPDSFSHPSQMVWTYRYGHAFTTAEPSYYAPDLDGDGRGEILRLTQNRDIGTGIWENVADNQNELKWHGSVGAWSFAFGDFDLDQRKEFVTGRLTTMGLVSVYECTGDDQYECTYQDSVLLPNCHDVFSGQDLDQDGRPEFYIRFWSVPYSRFYLYVWEATANNVYERTLVDQKLMSTQGSSRSICGDLDGDGVEELVWALPLGAYVYKAVGNNAYEEVWHWWDDHGTHECVIANVHDMNGNGYNDLVLAGSGKTSVFEVEAVRVGRPNGGEEYQAGDTCWIRWDTLTPPRCDSVSLFLRTDTVVPRGEWFWNLDTIVTGLAPGDTIHPWVVPDTVLDAAWIVAIAYGPGWQYDESDAPFRIRPSGIAENGAPRVACPVPEPTVVRNVLWLPRQSGDRPSLRGAVPVLLDISGRKVMELQPGENDLRHLSPGIYFLQTEGASGPAKVLVTR